MIKMSVNLKIFIKQKECELEDDTNEKTWTFKDEFGYVNDDENMENFG